MAPVRVGIIGCGEVAQVVHVPNLLFLHELFAITYLCDVSAAAVSHVARKIPREVHTTHDAAALCSSPDVDVVFVINADEYHVEHAVLALANDKHVFIEKPMALTLRDADALIAAAKKSAGSVMVGYQRRYATAFVEAVREIGGVGEIMYARVRDIIGPNSAFVGQSGTFPKVFTDVGAEAAEDKKRRGEELVAQALEKELGVAVSPGSTAMYRLLGSLGSHDLSVMREALGQPASVAGASLDLVDNDKMFWSVLFKYPGFTCTYESGIYGVPLFDAHIEVYGKSKSVKVQYDTPYVKGLPITMTVREELEGGGYQERVVRRTYEDAYTLEMRQLYGMCAEGKKVKTTPEDAREDLRTFGMIMQAGAPKSTLTTGM